MRAEHQGHCMTEMAHVLVPPAAAVTFDADRKLMEDAAGVDRSLAQVLPIRLLDKMVVVVLRSLVEGLDLAISFLAGIVDVLDHCSQELDWLCQVVRLHLHIRLALRKAT